MHGIKGTVTGWFHCGAGLADFQAYRCVAIGHIHAAKVISLTVCLDDRGNFE